MATRRAGRGTGQAEEVPQSRREGRAGKPPSLAARSGAIVLSLMAFALSACSRHEDPVPAGQVTRTVATVQAALVANGSACVQASDCASGFCSAGTCAGCKVAGATSTNPLGSDGRCNSPLQYCNLSGGQVFQCARRSLGEEEAM